MPQTLIESIPAFKLDEESRLAIERLVAADDPVDNPFSEVQQHFLFEAIKSSYSPPADPSRPGQRRKFWGASNVGIFKSKSSFLVPDMFISLDVERPDWIVERAYYLFQHKPPEIVVEVVSNNEGNELDSKKGTYAAWGIQHYVVYDPGCFLGSQVLHAFTLAGDRYVPMDVPFFSNLGIGVTLWTGVYADTEETYLRWCDDTGAPLRVGDEKVAFIEQRVNTEAQRANTEAQRANTAEARLEQERKLAASERARADEEAARGAALRALLREHGIDPGV